MTYIKWKDEVESYLINLSDAEKQKILSYFSEMYADKRDAGKSEAQIIEEFGAPYDVAKRILADSISAASQQDNSDGAGASVNGGNNYNYNYYNYNYGGAPAPNAPAPNAPPPPAKETPQKEFVAPAQQPAAIAQPAATQVKKKAGAGRIILGVFLAFLLGCLTISLIGSALAMIVESFISIGATAGMRRRGGNGYNRIQHYDCRAKLYPACAHIHSLPLSVAQTYKVFKGSLKL